MQIKSTGYTGGWRAAFIAIAVNLLLSLALAFTNIKSVQTAAFISTAAFTVFAFVFALFTERKNLCEGFRSMGWRAFSPKLLPFIILLPVSSQLFCSIFTMPVNGILQLLFGFSTKEQILAPDNASELISAVIYMCILAPVSEEIIFRGIVYKRFERYSTMAAIFLSALTFSVAHLDIRSLIQIFYIGLTLGVIRFVTGSLLATMVSHCAVNAFALGMLTLGDGYTYPVIVISLCVIFSVLMSIFLRKTKFPPFRRAHQRRGISVFMILTIIMYSVVQLLTLADNIYTVVTEHSNIITDFERGFSDGFDGDFTDRFEREFGIKID